MKSEPDAYSIDHFEKDGKTLWTGVRNYQARNFMTTAMKLGDPILFYHSNAEPSAVVGLGKIARINLPDPSALDPKSDYFDPKSSEDHPIWFCAEVEFVRRFPKPLSLAEIREMPKLADLLLLRKGQRLSILPVERRHFELITKICGG